MINKQVEIKLNVIVNHNVNDNLLSSGEDKFIDKIVGSVPINVNDNIN